MWLRLKEVFYGHMAGRHYVKYQKWRERLWQIKSALDPTELSTKRREALRREFNQIMDSLDHDKVIEAVEEPSFWN